VPSVVDNVEPKLAVPLTTGATVLTGGVVAEGVVMLLLDALALLVPILLVAVTVNV
jgi:hypothetical protein